MRHFLHIFIILAFVLSGISPACAFISGETSLDVEICTADGIKIVKMPGSETPDDSDHAHKNKTDCAFCFAQSHLKLAKAEPVVLSIAQSALTNSILHSEGVLATRFELSALNPRAPPLS